MKNSALARKKELVGKHVSLGQNIHIYPNVRIGDYTVIEDNSVIGHPSPQEFNVFIKSLGIRHDAQMDHFVKASTVIGGNCILRSGTIVYSGTRIGDRLDCGHNVIIRENCEIGNDVYILPGTQIHAHVRIGNNVRLFGFLSNWSVVEDDAAMLGIMAHKYRVKRGAVETAPIVKRGANIGMGAILVGDVIVGENAFVGANAVVTRNVKPNTTVVGVPARLIAR
ncbi:MAG: DapH/DapD/GlmU-related protein [Candidatus Bathyarchaeia archaeon]